MGGVKKSEDETRQLQVVIPPPPPPPRCNTRTPSPRMNPRRCSSPTLPTPRSRCSSCAPAAQTASSPAPRRPAGPSTSTTSSSSTQTHTRATTHTPSGSSSPAGSAERPMTARTAAASPGGISRTSTACRSQPRAGAAAGIYVRASAASLPYALIRYSEDDLGRASAPTRCQAQTTLLLPVRPYQTCRPLTSQPTSKARENLRPFSRTVRTPWPLHTVWRLPHRPQVSRRSERRQQ